MSALTKRMLQTLSLLLVAIATVALAGCRAVEPETAMRSDSFIVPSEYRLEVSTFNGPIEVTQGDGRSVSIVATIRQPNEVEYSAELDGSTLRVVTTAPDRRITPSPGVSLVITAPAGAEVDLRSGNGRIELVGVGTGGTLDTSNGSISLQDVAGEFVLDTSNGAVTLENVHCQINADTSNGRIEFTGSFDGGSSNSLETSNGGITVRVGAEANLHIDAETRNGGVDIDMPLNAATVGDIGTGSASLRLRSSNGSIDIR